MVVWIVLSAIYLLTIGKSLVYNGSMNNTTIKKLYTEKNWSLRMIADKFDTDHHKIKRVLESMGILIERKPMKPMTEQHKKNISTACKGREVWSTGKKMPKSSLYKNMATHIRFNVSVEWLSQFDDIEKLKFLNRCITSRSGRYGNDTEWYKEYVLKFYSDKQFNKLYQKWLGSNDRYLRPTIDHINPKANGGNNAIENLQFLTWFENRAKNDMPMVVWQKLKENIKDYLI